MLSAAAALSARQGGVHHHHAYHLAIPKAAFTSSGDESYDKAPRDTPTNTLVRVQTSQGVGGRRSDGVAAPDAEFRQALQGLIGATRSPLYSMDSAASSGAIRSTRRRLKVPPSRTGAFYLVLKLTGQTSVPAAGRTRSRSAWKLTTAPSTLAIVWFKDRGVDCGGGGGARKHSVAATAA